MMPLFCSRSRQQGSALIVAMLIVAIVSLISVRFAESFMLQLDQAEARHDAHLIMAYVHGAEQLASQLLSADAASGNIDHGLENWAQQIPPLPTDNGWLQVQIHDAQALFNLNNLVVKTSYAEDASASATVRFTPAQKQFIRLLQSFEDYPVSEPDAVMMTEALIDWIDVDDAVTGQGGAESLFYSGSSLSAQAANQLLSDISELRLVRHFNAEIVERLFPWVVVLPEPAPMNLNTTPVRLLSTINQPANMQVLTDPGLMALTNERAQRAFSTVEDYFNHVVIQQLVPDAEKNSGSDIELFSTGSHWFQLYSHVTVNGRSSRWLSLIARDEQQTIVWFRKKLY